MNQNVHLHAKKLLKRQRRNAILEGFREPKTIQELESLHNKAKNIYTNTVRDLFQNGYLKQVGISEVKGRPIIWQAIKFDYREEGVDYEIEPTVSVRQNLAYKPHEGLSNPVYRHNPDHEHFKTLYRQQNQQARSEYKSAKVWASVAEFI